MPASATFEVPFPPSLNHYYRQWYDRRKRRLMKAPSDAGSQYRENVAAAVWDTFGTIPKAIDFKIKVTIELIAPDRRKRDLDNYLKPLLDAFTEARVWADDSLIDDLRVLRGRIERPGRVILTIEKITHPERFDF